MAQLPAIPSATPREHIHRCPICDRFKRQTRQQVNAIRDQLREYFRASTEGRPVFLGPAAFMRFVDSIHLSLIRIEGILSPCETRRIQKMTDEEFNAYALPGQTGTSGDGEPRSGLILLQGGKNNG